MAADIRPEEAGPAASIRGDGPILRREAGSVGFDLGRVIACKQERESARLDAFEFHRKARTVRLVAERVRGRADAPHDIGPAAFATRVALAPLHAVMRDLRTLCAAGVTDEDSQRQVERPTGEACRGLVRELDDPPPHRMASLRALQPGRVASQTGRGRPPKQGRRGAVRRLRD